MDGVVRGSAPGMAGGLSNGLMAEATGGMNGVSLSGAAVVEGNGGGVATCAVTAGGAGDGRTGEGDG